MARAARRVLSGDAVLPLSIVSSVYITEQSNLSRTQPLLCSIRALASGGSIASVLLFCVLFFRSPGGGCAAAAGGVGDDRGGGRCSCAHQGKILPCALNLVLACTAHPLYFQCILRHFCTHPSTKVF